MGMSWSRFMVGRTVRGAGMGTKGTQSEEVARETGEDESGRGLEAMAKLALIYSYCKGMTECKLL